MKFSGIVLCALWTGAGAVAYAGQGDTVRQLLESQGAQAAYDQGRTTPENLGDPEFDFYFGIAAIDAGDPGAGVLALERYLVRFPDNPSAHFQLARAYFATGENDAARIEFQDLQKAAQGPMRLAVDQYLAAIEQRLRGPRSSWKGYWDVALGYDSNLTSGIDADSQPVIPGFGVLPTQPALSTGVTAADQYATTATAWSRAWALAPSLVAGVNLAADWKIYGHSENQIFDQSSLHADSTLAYDRGDSQYRVALGLTQTYLDHQPYLQSPALSGEWAYRIAPQSQLSLGLQTMNLRYRDGCSYFERDESTSCIDNQASQRDSTLNGLSLGWSLAPQGPWNTAWGLSLSLAQERNTQDTASLSRNIQGLRLNLAMAPSERHVLNLALSWQGSVYQDIFPGGDEARTDHLWSLDLDYLMRLDAKWALKGGLSWSQQDSNIGLYTYKRSVASIGLRRVFN